MIDRKTNIRMDKEKFSHLYLWFFFKEHTFQSQVKTYCTSVNDDNTARVKIIKTIMIYTLVYHCRSPSYTDKS